LYHQGRRFTFESESDEESEDHQNASHQSTLEAKRFTRAGATRVAKSTAGPHTPAQAHDLLTAFRTKIWTIMCEERQSPRIINNPEQKQPISGQMRPKSARLKNF
jgi:hypothetical protein